MLSWYHLFQYLLSLRRLKRHIVNGTVYSYEAGELRGELEWHWSKLEEKDKEKAKRYAKSIDM